MSSPVMDGSSTADAASALAQSTRLHQALAIRLSAERAQLAALEQESRGLHDTLALMERSAGRRLYLRFRAVAVRVLLAIRHPVWTAVSLLRAIAATPAPAAARAAIRHLLHRAFPLRLVAPVAERTDQPEDFSAIRWIGPVSVRHEAMDALFCHPASSVDYRASAPSGSRFVTALAISPNAWRHDPGPIDFRVNVQIPASGWTSSVERRLDPARRFTDRRWHHVEIELPPREQPSIDVLVTLETRVSPGGCTGYAWALFGDPRLEWRRPTIEVRRTIRTFLHRLRTDGLRGTLALLSRGRSTEEEAAQYSQWCSTHTRSDAELAALGSEVAALPNQPLISVVTPVFNTDPKWLRACIESVRRQVYPNWELCLCDDASTTSGPAELFAELADDERIRVVKLPANQGISTASNAAVALARGEYVALLDHDDELTPDALAEVVRWLNAHPDTAFVYSDEDKLDLTGRRCDPAFKPDWSPELFLHRMYTCHLAVVRKDVLDSVGGFRKGYEGAQDYDLLLRVMERTDRIGHVPMVLYHWRKLHESTASAGAAKPWANDAGRRALDDYVERQGGGAEVLPGAGAGLFRVKRQVREQPLVSIVIPTAGQMRDVRGTPVDLLAQAIASVTQKTTWPHYEFVIIAEAAGIQETSRRALAGARHRIIQSAAEGPFNFSRRINQGVSASAGTHVVLFNDDLEVIDPEWLTAMLEYSQDPGVGAVGAKLLYPDGRLQHVGMILGVNGIAAHAYHQHPGTIPGYMGCTLGPRNYSAVTAACLMTRRAVFDDVGRFDEVFPTDFNDVDFCLRVRRAGYRIVWTPYARLFHHESASFGPRAQDPAGIEEMRRRWGPVLTADPYYNPSLSREHPDFRVGA